MILAFEGPTVDDSLVEEGFEELLLPVPDLLGFRVQPAQLATSLLATLPPGVPNDLPQEGRDRRRRLEFGEPLDEQTL